MHIPEDLELLANFGHFKAIFGYFWLFKVVYIPEDPVLEHAGDDIILSNPVGAEPSDEHLGRLRIPRRLQSFIDLQKSLGMTRNRLGESIRAESSGFSFVGEVGTEKETAESLDSPELCRSFEPFSSSSLSRPFSPFEALFLVFITNWPF